MADLTLGSDYQENKNYGSGLDCTFVKNDTKHSVIKVQWETVTLGGKTVLLTVTATGTHCNKLNGKDIETSTKTYADFMTETSGDLTPASLTTWLTTNFTDVIQGT